MKYYIGRKSKLTGRVDYRRCKCVDKSWVSEKYIRLHPSDVWQFSAQGARKIVETYNKYRENKAVGNWGYEYFMVPVSAFLGE